MSIHRKIWKKHFGPIPKDGQGRSMEIHHIDGDHNNNDINNLKLVTIEEHYQIHYDQGDYGACVIMSHRMRLTPDEISGLSSKCQKKLVAEGRHAWLGPHHNQQLIAKKIHPFLDKEAARQRNLKRIAQGTHNLVGKNNPVHALIAQGKHHFQIDNPSKKKAKDGTHHFLTNHPNKVKLCCPHCQKIGGAVNMQRYHFENCKKKTMR